MLLDVSECEVSKEGCETQSKNKKVAIYVNKAKDFQYVAI